MAEPRWDVLDIDGVNGVIERAARNVNDLRSHTTEFEDLAQEARIMVATTPSLIEVLEREEPQLGLLYNGLRQDLLDATKTESKHMGSRLSYERMVEHLA